MEEILKNKIAEVSNELKEVLAKDIVPENEKNFLCGELTALTTLLIEISKKEEV